MTSAMETPAAAGNVVLKSLYIRRDNRATETCGQSERANGDAAEMKVPRHGLPAGIIWTTARGTSRSRRRGSMRFDSGEPSHTDMGIVLRVKGVIIDRFGGQWKFAVGLKWGQHVGPILWTTAPVMHRDMAEDRRSGIDVCTALPRRRAPIV